jgi:probable F420-dependent oxidoreductase
MKLDTALAAASLKDVPAAARAAEEMGFDAVWTAETGHDPYFPLVLAAEHTQRIKLGTSIAVAFPRSPMIHAMTAWDLQAMSGGRFILGLGTQVRGHNERRFGIKWESPGPRLREMIQMIRAVWDSFQNGTRPKFEGKFYNFTLMTPFFNGGPIEHPNIPIYIAGVNEYMCRLAGELCDGFHVHPFHSLEYLRGTILPNIDAGAHKAGRKRSDCKLSTSVFVIVGDSEEERTGLRGLVKQQISFYASTPAYKPVLDAHGWGDTQAKLNDKARSGDWGGMADLITDEMLNVYAVTGTWDEIAGKLKARYHGILDRLAFYVPFRAGDKAEKWRAVVRAFND